MRALRPSPALVVACLALVIASAQPVAAAVTALVPTNSVGTAQLKAGAVTTPKLHDGAVTSRKITNGSVGLLDLASAARPKPPTAFFDSSNFVSTPEDGGFAYAAGVDLPKGSWVILAKVLAQTLGGVASADFVTCNLVVGEDSLDMGTASFQAGATAGQSYLSAFPLTTLLTVATPTRVDLRCNEAAGDGLDAYIQRARLVAFQATLPVAP